MHSACHCIFYFHSIIDYTELQPPIVVPLCHFMPNLSSISCESVLCLNIVVIELIKPLNSVCKHYQDGNQTRDIFKTKEHMT